LLAFGGDVKFAGKAFWFPWKVAPYFLIAIIGNIIFCEYVRGVDAPLTDYWTIPIGQNEALGAIDTPDKWNLWPTRGGGEAIVAEVSNFAKTENALFGEAESGLFVYWLSPESRLEILSKENFAIQLSNAGLSLDDLVVPEDYYFDSRWAGDLITVLIILALPIYWFGSLVRGALQSVKGQNKGADATAI
jgi:hypothetical protein